MAFWRNLFSDFQAFRSAMRTGFMPFHMLGNGPQFNDYTKDADKIKAIFSNPALLKIFSLQCDLFSLGRPYVYNKAGKIVDHDAIDRINNPNPMQSRADWLWSYMFWKMCGNAYLYTTSTVVSRDNAPMYWLENHKIEWPPSMDAQKDKLILSTAKLNRLLETEIKYRYEDGTTQDIKLKEILHIADLSNGVGNWFKGFSKIDSLFKVISNSEASLDSKNINVRYAGKFMVAGTANPNDISKKIMGEDEKKDIEDKVNREDKQVHAVKSMIEIKRFVDDLKVLELDKSYLADYFLIGSHYNIPRDILEAYTSSTYENQEKAMARHVAYTMEPAGDALGDDLAKHWSLGKGWRLTFGWDHLPFSQVFEREKAATKQTQVQVLTALLRAGVPIAEINVFLDTNFTIDDAQRQQQQQPANSGASQNA